MFAHVNTCGDQRLVVHIFSAKPILLVLFSLNLGAHHVCQIRWAMSSKVCLSLLSCGHIDVYFSAWFLLSCWGCKPLRSCSYSKHFAHGAIAPTPRICSFRPPKPWAGSLSSSVFHNWISYAICMSLWVKESKIAKYDYSLGLLHHHAIYTGLLLERKRGKCFLGCHNEWWAEACDETFPGKIISSVARMSRHFLGHQVGKRKSPKVSMFDHFSDLQTAMGSAGVRRALVLRWGALYAPFYFS